MTALTNGTPNYLVNAHLVPERFQDINIAHTTQVETFSTRLSNHQERSEFATEVILEIFQLLLSSFRQELPIPIVKTEEFVCFFFIAEDEEAFVIILRVEYFLGINNLSIGGKVNLYPARLFQKQGDQLDTFYRTELRVEEWLHMGVFGNILQEGM